MCWALDHVTGDGDTGEEGQNPQLSQSPHAEAVSITGVRVNRRRGMGVSIDSLLGFCCQGQQKNGMVADSGGRGIF